MQICKDPLLISADRYEKFEVLREINDQISLIYQKFKGSLILEPRDMVIARFMELTDEYGTLLDISVNTSSLPEQKGILRCYQHVSIKIT